jgi:hypothetical protein
VKDYTWDRRAERLDAVFKAAFGRSGREGATA